MEDTQEQEIANMNEALESNISEAIDKPTEDSTSEAEEEVVDQDDTLTEDPSTESELDEKDKVIEELRKELDALRPEKPSEGSAQPESTELPLDLSDHDFIGDLDPEDIVESKTDFNKLLNEVYKKGVEDARKLTSEKVLLAIPEIVRNTFQVYTTMKEASDKFYSDNKDLIPYKQTVAAVFEEVYAKNPGKTLTEVFPAVSEEARKRLKLQLDADKPTPRLPKKSGRASIPSPTPNLSPMEAEIAEMNKLLGG